MNPFTPTDRKTWPELLTVVEMSAIFRRSVLGIRKAVQLHRFTPAPFQRRPYLWRKADVVRVLDAGRGAQMRKAG